MKKFLNNKCVKIFIMSFICIIITLFLEKFYFKMPINFIRDFIVFAILFFIGLNFLLDRKKMWDFIYRKRYFIGSAILLFTVIFGLHGSSIDMWTDYIQPEYYRIEFSPIFGKARTIRSDEWVVNTPIDLSQSKLKPSFSSINYITRGSNTSTALVGKGPIKDLNMIVNPFKIGFIFFNNQIGLSLFWYGKLIVFILVTFEMLMIITNGKKKLSFIGSLLISFAPVVQWWYAIDIILYGEAAVIVLNAFYKTQKIKFRILLAIAMGIIGSQYICCYYPAWQIPYGYLFLVLFIWIIYNNRKKLRLSDLLYTLIVLSIVAGIVGYVLYTSKDALFSIMNTVYPGHRISTGGTGWELLFTYISSFLYSFKDLANPCEYSQFFTLFPIPIIIGCYLLIQNRKEKKKDLLLFMLTTLILLLLIWNFVKIPPIIAKLSLLYMSTPQRSQVTIGYILVLLLIYIFANYSDKIKFNKIIAYFLAIIIPIYGINLIDNMFPQYMTATYIAFISIICFGLIVMILTNCKKDMNIILTGMFLVTVIPGINVNPVSIGIDVVYEKPIAKEIQKIVKDDNKGKWIVISPLYLTPNYFIINGAPTLNSVNFYPNLELWHKVDKEHKYEDIYNRYAHILINLVEEDSNFEFVEGYDLIRLNLNYEDIDELDIKYIASNSDLNEIKLDSYGFSKIYDEYGMNIYQLQE